MKYDFEESVGVWLAIAHQSYGSAIADRLRPHGITFRQAQVLGYLEFYGPQSQADLAARMMIEPPSLVGVLNRMERNQLVERKTCPLDSRSNLVHLLPAAESLWNNIANCAREVRSAALRGMSKREIDELKRLLNRVTENVNAI